MSLKTATLIAIIGTMAGFFPGRVPALSQNSRFELLRQAVTPFESARGVINWLWAIIELIGDGSLIVFLFVLHSKQKPAY